MLKIYTGWLLLVIGTFLAAFITRKSRQGKPLLRLSYGLFLLLVLEGGCVLFYFYYTGTWTFRGRENYNIEFFEADPYLVATPKPNLKLSFNGKVITHNAEGFRGPVAETPKSKVRIAVVGGSTSYGVGVNDWETWPHYLDSLLPDSFEVLNFGIPGHNSVEHVVFSGLHLPTYQPDYVIVHAGLNDLQSSFVAGLERDQSNFHEPNLRLGLGQSYRNRLPPLAMLKSVVIGLQELDLYPTSSYYQQYKSWSDTTANLALESYAQNLHTLVALIKGMGAQPIFVPQLLHAEAIANDQLAWWVPFVPEEEMLSTLGHFNRAMEAEARQSEAVFARQIVAHPWTVRDFADPSHLNGAANLQFAQLLLPIWAPTNAVPDGLP